MSDIVAPWVSSKLKNRLKNSEQRRHKKFTFRLDHERIAQFRRDFVVGDEAHVGSGCRCSNRLPGNGNVVQHLNIFFPIVWRFFYSVNVNIDRLVCSFDISLRAAVDAQVKFLLSKQI